MKSEKGQSLVETALMLPVIFTILFGIIDFGMLLQAHLAIEHAGREGARWASIHSTDSEKSLESKVAGYAVGLNASELKVNVKLLPDEDDETETNVKVTIKYNYYFITPLIDFLKLITKVTKINIPDPIPIEDVTWMRVE